MWVWFLLGNGGAAKPALAQSSEQAAALAGLLWIGAIVLAFLAVVVLLQRLRRRMNSSHSESGADFTLDELRRLRDGGSLTAAEYEAIKRKSLHSSGKFPS